jgi:hypothetical protein
MAIRTNQLFGKVWGDPVNKAIITVEFNNQQVYSGPVPTVAGQVDQRCSQDSMEALCEWTTDSSVEGSVPVKVTIEDGDLLLYSIKMNQLITNRALTTHFLKPNVTWPAHVPESYHDLTQDRLFLHADDFEEKYSMTKATALADFISSRYTYPTLDDFLIPPRTEPGDCKINLKLNGVELTKLQLIGNSGSSKGEWSWLVTDGCTLEFDFQIDAPVVVVK